MNRFLKGKERDFKRHVYRNSVWWPLIFSFVSAFELLLDCRKRKEIWQREMSDNCCDYVGENIAYLTVYDQKSA